LLLALTAATSCNDWLDVDLKTKVKSDDLLTTEAGFKDALVGVYISMISEQLYGRELTFGFFEAITGNYDVQMSNTQYYDITQGNISTTAIRSRIDAMWLGLYKTVANINNILDNIDDKRPVFTGDNYEIIKGEALALRAFLHLAVFRIFGDARDLSLPAVPYVTTLGTTIFPALTGKDVLQAVMDDLDAALLLLKSDPIYKNRSKVNTADAFLHNRQMRMNYYAAMAVYAEAAMWAGDKTKALKYATDVIAVCDELFPWVDRGTVSTSVETARDRTFSTEHIFCLNVFNLRALYNTWHSPTTAYLQNVLYKGSWNFETWYQSMRDTDIRFTYLSQFSNTIWGYHSLKFMQPDGYRPEYAARIPLIRRSMMYYIAAECSGNIETATNYLNQVRRNRGIAADLSGLTETSFATELQREYIKEFWCEGQLFFYMKRRNETANPLDRWLPFQLRDRYVIAMPEAEIDYGL